MFLKEEPFDFALLAVSLRNTSKLSNGSSSLGDIFRRLVVGIASCLLSASSRRRAFDMSAVSSSLSAITTSPSAQSAEKSSNNFFADRHYLKGSQRFAIKHLYRVSEGFPEIAVTTSPLLRKSSTTEPSYDVGNSEP